MSDNRIKKQMLETKDIIKKMNELSEKEVAMSCNSCSDENDNCPTCPDDIDCLLVPFCCTTTLPEGFKLSKCKDEFLIYDVSCLSCCFEECQIKRTTHCCGTDIVDCIDGFAVKVVGCIRFIASAYPVVEDGSCELCGGKLKKSCGKYDEFTDNGKGHICCQGSVCVDKVIGCGIQDEDLSGCDCECPELSCKTVKVRNFKVEEKHLCPDCKCDDCHKKGNAKTKQRTIVFSGCFEIPPCAND